MLQGMRRYDCSEHFCHKQSGGELAFPVSKAGIKNEAGRIKSSGGLISQFLGEAYVYLGIRLPPMVPQSSRSDKTVLQVFVASHNNSQNTGELLLFCFDWRMELTEITFFQLHSVRRFHYQDHKPK